MPVHGETRMLAAHARLAEEMGVDPERIFICENGDVLELERGSLRRNGEVEAGDPSSTGSGSATRRTSCCATAASSRPTAS